jgi:large subunit ribosomal protein L31
MKSGIHPLYRKVLFVDSSTGDEWVSYSTMSGSDTRAHQGEDLPLIRLDISSFSHPFWTGQSREVDTEGRMDRFRRRYNVRGGAQAAAPAAAKPAPAAAKAAPVAAAAPDVTAAAPAAAKAAKGKKK